MPTTKKKATKKKVSRSPNQNPKEAPPTENMKLELPPLFNEVEGRLRSNINTMTQQHFRRALRAAGLPNWDLHNSAAFQSVEKRARDIASDPAFIVQTMSYFRGTPGSDSLGLCRFISIIAGFRALSEVITNERPST